MIESLKDGIRIAWHGLRAASTRQVILGGMGTLAITIALSLALPGDPPSAFFTSPISPISPLPTLVSPIPTPEHSPTSTPRPTVLPLPTRTPDVEAHWWDSCPGAPDCPPEWPIQPTYTPAPMPTCLPTPVCPDIGPSPTAYPTATPYPPQPTFEPVGG